MILEFRYEEGSQCILNPEEDRNTTKTLVCSLKKNILRHVDKPNRETVSS